MTDPTATTEPGNYLAALDSDGTQRADRLDREAEVLEIRAHGLRMEAVRLRAAARALGRFAANGRSDD